MLYKQIGIRLKRRRKEMKLTQERVAEMADISVSFYGAIERGARKMSMETFCRLISSLDCSADEILGTGVAGRRRASALELLRMAEEISASLKENEI